MTTRRHREARRAVALQTLLIFDAFLGQVMGV
jgi:hypothetical protein